MNTQLSPIKSEFATTEEAEAYDRWFRAKVQESLDDDSPLIPQDQVMAEMQKLLDEKHREHAATYCGEIRLA
ncbi:MAG: antitoxin [Nitrosomonadales bacterium]|nr:antitoxin [Nitrosomonadales bacterium]